MNERSVKYYTAKGASPKTEKKLHLGQLPLSAELKFHSCHGMAMTLLMFIVASAANFVGNFGFLALIAV